MQTTETTAESLIKAGFFQQELTITKTGMQKGRAKYLINDISFDLS